MKTSRIIVFIFVPLDKTKSQQYMNLFTKKFYVLSAIALIIASLTAWVDDPPNYHTGAPGELTCGSCHIAPTSNASTGLIEIVGLPDTLSPDTDYPITIRMTKTFGTASQAGFQMTLINERLEKMGTFSNPSPGSAVSVQNYRDYFEHRPAAIFPANNVVEWSINWHSPKEEEAFSQNIKIYSTGLLGNADSSITGDVAIGTFKTYYFKSPYTKIGASFSSSPVTCSGGNDGYVNVTVVGGRAPYKYRWNTGDTTKNIEGLKAGSYGLTITDDGIDTFYNNVTVNQPFPVFGTIIKTDIPCNSTVSAEAIVVPSSGVPPYTFLWSNDQTGNTASFDSPGQKFVTITDANLCTYVASTSIIKKGDFTASTTNIDNVKCNGGSTGAATVITSIPFPTSYLWSNGAGTATVVGLSAGEYSVTVSDVDGCEARATATILEPTNIKVSTNVVNQPSCQGSYNGLLSIFADGGVPPYTYEWENGTTLKTISSLIAGDYSVTVTDAFGCTVADTLTLSEPDPIAADIDFLNESGPGLNNGKANIIATGGTAPYTFTWSDGPVSKDRSNLKPGYYTITITDVKGCNALTSLYIYPYNCTLVVNDALIENIDCNGDNSGSIALDVSGGTAPYVYSWSNGNQDQDLNNVKSGKYTVTITDNAGCMTHGYFNINQPPPFKKILNVTDVTNPDFVDGEVKFIFSGGVPPYTLIFDVADTISSYTGIVTFDNLFNGLHSYSVTDANGCNFSEFFIINVEGCLLRPGNLVIQDVKCYGDTDGAICLSVQNATGAYSIFWDDESSELCRLNLSAGKYNVHLSDEAGCQSLDTFTIKQPSAIRQVNANLIKPDFGENNGSISVVNAGGIPTYIYRWYKDGALFPGNESALLNIGAGMYFYEVIDGNGCLFVSDTINLENLPLATGRIKTHQINIAPNPTNSLITLSTGKTINGEITIVNALGQIVKTDKFTNQDKKQLDVSSLSSGIYGILIKSEKEVYSGRIVKID